MEETKESDEDESYCDLAALLPAKARAIKKYPLQINTEESLNRFTLVRPDMNDGQAGTGPLRQLHTFSFTRGRIEAPTMREELGAVFRQIRESEFAAAFSSDRVERRGDSESAVVGRDGDEAIAGSSSDDVDDDNTETGQHEEFVTEYPSANIGVETEVRYPSVSIGVETEVRNEPETPPTVFPNDDMAEQPNGLAGAFGVLARPDDRNMYRLINDDGAGDDLACGDFVGMAFDSEEDAFITSRFTHLPIQNPTVGKRRLMFKGTTL
uniref:Uncharacterized protein n=1 Tax=Phytophthora fragariae TaxID=53985 RepID=A0A6A3DS54_9STRA|nr:hypothetical protein PF009_g26796 [Phytophthora fragariae]